MKHAWSFLLAFGLLALLAAPRVRAQSFTPGPGVFATAGGAAASGEFDAVASIGQPVLGVATHTPGGSGPGS